jgi:hypothetical protein
MASSIPLQAVEIIKTAHIRRDLSPQHDPIPSTAASKTEPVVLEEKHAGNDDGMDEGEEESIPYSVLRPNRRSAQLPPLPDLRFEQSYLQSISQANTWWKVAWITMRDQASKT